MEHSIANEVVRVDFPRTGRAFTAPDRRMSGPGCPETLRAEVLDGLLAGTKSVPGKYLYDARGSELFAHICGLQDYYPARTEMALLRRAAPSIGARLPANARLAELASGRSEKARLLLEAIPHLTRYDPIDICSEVLADAVAGLSADYPGLVIEPRVGDFCSPGLLKRGQTGFGSLLFMPGSTIANVPPAKASLMAARWKRDVASGTLFLVGVDLVKDCQSMLRAYNDREGLTAAFNLNLLARLNRELDGHFDLDAFEHRACWNGELERVEMNLVSKHAQIVDVAGARIRFAATETILTQTSYKYRPGPFVSQIETAGWQFERCWIDETHPFGLFLFKAI